MDKQNEWLDVQAAADFVGKSVSTLRRWLRDTEGKDYAAGNIRREPFKDKGGEKILIARAFLVEQFGKGSAPDISAAGGPAAGEQSAALVEILERQLNAKDGQINAFQRESEAKNRQIEQAQQTASDLAERVREMAALNAALQTKILLLSEKAGEQAAPAASPAKDRESVFSSPAYFIAVAVALSLCIGLALWLFLS